MVRNSYLSLCIAIISIIVSCKSAELSPEEKAQVNELKGELEQIQTDIVDAEKIDQQYEGGLIKLLIETRLEILKTNKALLEQRINSIESGSPVTTETFVTNADPELAGKIQKEIDSVNKELQNAKSEAKQYSGGLIYALKQSSVATYEQTVAMLKQRYLIAKYGLAFPKLLTPEDIKKE
ncbi:MAG: hypothetical protein WBD99_10600, partial [Thermodesulfobacteriota bacterium]